MKYNNKERITIINYLDLDTMIYKIDKFLNYFKY